MDDLLIYSRYGKFSKAKDPIVTLETAVSYTRVSTKEQFDTNLSLFSQKKAISYFAERKNIKILAEFGGTYESAKTDGRIEFERMLKYVRARKGKIKYILVYALDRFSRTGAQAIVLKDELRKKYGVYVDSVLQPTDGKTVGGRLQQNVSLLFSGYDNELRAERTVGGMRDALDAGYWVAPPPLGYSSENVKGEKIVVVNETGRIIKKIFQWKYHGMKNPEIITRVRKLGMDMYPQLLAKILCNPFYCGIMVHGVLDGKAKRGRHEKLVSETVFKRINSLLVTSTRSGVPHLKERDEVPLKTFIKCDICNEPFTGYIVKKKLLWYYKCRTKGCKCNRNAKVLHEKFESYLNYLMLDDKYVPLIHSALLELHYKNEKDNIELSKKLKARTAELTEKIENLEEKFFTSSEMSKEVFKRLNEKLANELIETEAQLLQTTISISNLESKVSLACDISTKLATIWKNAPMPFQERFQYLVFPEGIIYDRKIDAFRTNRINSVFSWIAEQKHKLAEKEKVEKSPLGDFSTLVAQHGFEPRHSDPETDVLPLYYWAKNSIKRLQYYVTFQ